MSKQCSCPSYYANDYTGDFCPIHGGKGQSAEVAEYLKQKRESGGAMSTDCKHVIIGNVHAGHCVYCHARFPGRFVEYIRRVLIGQKPLARAEDSHE